MKIARIIGLAAIAALALTALVGAGSASAAKTTLCKTSTNTPYCQATDRYAANTEIKASTGEFTIQTTTPKITVACTESSFEGKTTAESGEPLPLSVSKWTVGSCSKGCTVEFKKLPYTGSLSRTSGSNGTMTVGSGGGGEPRLFLKCGEPVNCEYQVPSATVEGGSSGQMTLPETALVQKAGFACPVSATLKPVKYAVSTPKPVYVATPPLEEVHTRLCKAAESPCKAENTYPFGTTMEAEAPALTIKTSGGSSDITCGKTTMSAATLAVGAEPLPFGPVAFTFNECVWPPMGKCTVTSSSSATGATLHSEGTFAGSLQIAASWKFQCGGVENPVTCILGFAGANASFFGSGVFDKERATFLYEETNLNPESLSCPTTNTLTATFTVSSPKPLFAT